MSTMVSVNTYTYAVTFVTEKIVKSLQYIITSTGLDPNKLVGKWSSYELAVETWLRSGHLRVVSLEIVSPAGSFVTRWDLEINYSYGGGDGSMWVDKEALKYAILKCGVMPSSCTYNILIENAPGRPDVVGWGPGTYLSTEGFIKQGLGTTIGTSSIGTQAAFWRKS